jgi:flavin reductase (DIM6/NTAB) family NADH-FMN oxidoreductase RutF
MSDLDLNFADLAPRQRYKLLCGLVVPRPIALVSTLSPDGVVNAAPFSFFNAFSENPALIVLGLQHNEDGSPKDTTRNNHVSGEFVVNLVDEAIAEAMNITATDFPPEESEPAIANLRLAASTLVKPPRLADAPAAFECRRVVRPGLRTAARAADRGGAGRARARGDRRSRHPQHRLRSTGPGRPPVRQHVRAPARHVRAQTHHLRRVAQG